jgi:energy-coupling factor transporter ATP-binding protein EcfA2
MSEDKTDDFPFQIIPEEASIEDAYTNEAHQRLADTIQKSFQDNNKGFTLGLEGRYGSGKSTVIKLLKQSVENEENSNSFLFCYFDAWAHEDDPLRRVFLEELIKQCLDKENSKFKKLKDQIAGKRFKRKTNIKRGSTIFGFFMAITALLIPIGVAIFSIIDKSNLTLQYTGDINPWAFIASVLISGTAITLIVNLLILFIKWISGKIDEIFVLKHWALFQSKGNEKITENIKKSDERTSIEFEQFFYKIIKKLNLNSDKKLIIVLDNIDRTLPKDTKKLISTLQNFLTESSGLIEKEKEFDFVYTIIPYDLEGLNFRFAEESMEFENIKAFLDKNIRLKLKVPDLIINDWRESFKNFIENHLADWDKSVINDVVEILYDLYPHATFSPTPRELKIYVNQLGIHRNHFNPKVISTRVLCFYIIKKFMPREFDDNEKLEEFSDKKIITGIINKEIPTKREHLVVNEKGFIDQLITIVYDLKNSRDAFLLILEKEIINVLSKSDNKANILHLEELHGDNFWIIVKQIFHKTQNQIDLFMYLHSIVTIYNENEKINFLENICNSLISDISYDALKHYSDNSDFLERTLSFIIEYSSDGEPNKFLNECVDALIVTSINEKVTEDYIISNYSILKKVFTNSEITDQISKFTPRTLDDEFNWELYSRIVYLSDFDKPFLLLKEESVDFIFKRNAKSNFRNEYFPYFLILITNHELIKPEDIIRTFNGIIQNSNIWTDSIQLGENAETQNQNINLLKIEYIDLYYYLIVNFMRNDACYELLNSLSSTSQLNKKLPFPLESRDDFNFKYLTAYYYIKTYDYSDDHSQIEFDENKITYEVNFKDYFKSDIEKNNTYKQFWEITKNPKAKMCSLILLEWMFNKKTEIFYEDIELGYLFTATILLQEQNVDKKEIRRFCTWFKNNTKHKDLEGPALVDAYYQTYSILELEFENEVYREIFRSTFRITVDF